MKHDMITYCLAGIMIFSFVGVNFGSIRTSDPVMAGEELNVYTNINNDAPNGKDDLIVRTFFMDFGDEVVSSRFDLGKYDTHAVHTSYDVPSYAKGGEYVVRITAENDDEHITKYRFFIVE